MDEHIARERAIDALERIDWYHINDKGRLVHGGTSEMETYVPFKAVEEMLKTIPAADVRPVVCCKDCVYAYPYGLEIKCTKHSGRADRFGEDATYSEFHEGSWFCADGEERKHD